MGVASRGRSDSRSEVLTLLSGGLDSTACVGFYRRLDLPVRGLFVDYGQLGAPQEFAAATAVASHFRIPLLSIAWGGAQDKRDGLILGRNAALLFAGLMELKSSHGLVAIGIHRGTRYFDCSPPFVSAMQGLFDGYADGRVRIGAPFLDWTKHDIWSFSLEAGVPVELTYSCELGKPQPCGECASCGDLSALHAR